MNTTPAVAGIKGASDEIKTGDRLIVDAIAGVVFINPPTAIEREYQRVEAEIRTDHERLRDLIDVPAVTRDGTTITMLANVSKFADTEAALMVNAGGIGLYRTEFAYAIRDSFPTEDEQYEFLTRAAARFDPRPVVFRLLDLGADKSLPYFPLADARNPAPIGAMIEIPSAAIMARSLAREVDFFSLGTNDLVQYALAADREDERIAPYYQPLHPAVLQMIAMVVEAAEATGRSVSICGDLAADPECTELLLGLGLRELSVAPGKLLDVKRRVRETTLDGARALARRALAAGSADEVDAILSERNGAQAAVPPIAAAAAAGD